MNEENLWLIFTDCWHHEHYGDGFNGDANGDNRGFQQTVQGGNVYREITYILVLYT